MLQGVYHHCFIRLRGSSGNRDYGVLNDLDHAQIRERVVDPWHANRPFAVAEKIARHRDDIAEIQIVRTGQSVAQIADRHYAAMRAQGIMDGVTDPKKLPFDQGEDVTHELLFQALASNEAVFAADREVIIGVCRRIRHAASMIATRRRSKPPFVISDEYDVQDILHACIRAVTKHSIEEDVIGKIGGASSRVDLSFESLGLLVEVKYVRAADEVKEFTKQVSQDLLLYSRWQPLRELVVLVYNSGLLRDGEALEQLEGEKNISGRRFNLTVVLV